MKNLKRTFYILGIFAFCLIGAAFFTISTTFCLQNDNHKYPVWNIQIAKGSFINKNSHSFENNNIVKLKVNLDNEAKESYTSYFFNAGSITGKIDKISIDELNTVIGVSNTTNKIYYLKDYVDVSYYYLDDNLNNAIKKDSIISSGDIIKPGTRNNFKIDIKRKDHNKLSKDAFEVLNNSNYSFNLELTFKFDIKE